MHGSRVLTPTHHDMTLPLLQGDVGSGKTVVAFMAVMAAVGGGCQAVIMASIVGFGFGF